ncbi:hypothetical protein E2C01_099949 [Portunus trituberculatus]|uniref:Uncharacterized protein n=1 Tax=Portunus trituberculatus TaxID=210409 RepID=A0A5B7KAT5_PORTR|nr:hypothetical protein [Portunus trituberculatus]
MGGEAGGLGAEGYGKGEGQIEEDERLVWYASAKRHIRGSRWVVVVWFVFPCGWKVKVLECCFLNRCKDDKVRCQDSKRL